MILAAIGPIALLIGQQLIGISMLGITWKPTHHLFGRHGGDQLCDVAGRGLSWSALIIDALAPSFNGTKDPVKAFKVAAYSATAGWVAAILNIIPMLGIARPCSARSTASISLFSACRA